MGQTGTNKFRNPPGTQVSQRNGHTGSDTRSGNLHRVCRAVGLEGSPTTRWTTPLRTLITTAHKSEALRTWSAVSKACSRAMMWFRLLAAVPASSSESKCDGLRSAPMGCRERRCRTMDSGLKLACAPHMTAQSAEHRFTSPTYRSSIDSTMRPT